MEGCTNAEEQSHTGIHMWVEVQTVMQHMRSSFIRLLCQQKHGPVGVFFLFTCYTWWWDLTELRRNCEDITIFDGILLFQLFIDSHVFSLSGKTKWIKTGLRDLILDCHNSVMKEVNPFFILCSQTDMKISVFDKTNWSNIWLYVFCAAVHFSSTVDLPRCVALLNKVHYTWHGGDA